MGCPEVWARVAVTTGICKSLAREKFGPHQATPVSCCPGWGPLHSFTPGRGGGLVSLTLRVKASSAQGATWDSEDLWEEWERPPLGPGQGGTFTVALGPSESDECKLVKTWVRRPNALWVETGPSSSLFLGGAQGPSGWGLIPAHPTGKSRSWELVQKKCFRSQWDV